MAREDRAALLGSESERWLRADVRAPLWIPERYAALKPLGSSEVVDILERRRARSPRANGTIANLFEVRESLGRRTSRRLDGFLDNSVPASVSTCPCCVGYARAETARSGSAQTTVRVPKYHCYDQPASAEPLIQQLEATKGPIEPAIRVKADPPVIQFDQDTWQTTVTESLVVSLADDKARAPQTDPDTLARVRNVLRNSSPERWAAASAAHAGPDGDPFFKVSRPGLWLPSGGFSPAAASDQPLDAWRGPDGGQLEEETSWNSGTGDDSDSGALIYITIKNYVNRIDSDSPSLEFDYLLHHCASYRSGPLNLKDILDVDGGHFQGTFEDGQLTIKASKSIHFRAANPADRDAAILLNLLAPATTAMLMRELVYDGTLSLLNALPTAPQAMSHPAPTYQWPSKPSAPADRDQTEGSRSTRPPPDSISPTVGDLLGAAANTDAWDGDVAGNVGQEIRPPKLGEA